MVPFNPENVVSDQCKRGREVVMLGASRFCAPKLRWPVGRFLLPVKSPVSPICSQPAWSLDIISDKDMTRKVSL